MPDNKNGLHEPKESKIDEKDHSASGGGTDNLSQQKIKSNLAELQAKLSKQRARLIKAAEESFLEDGSLLHDRVAEEADKFFALTDSLAEEGAIEEEENGEEITP